MNEFNMCRFCRHYDNFEGCADGCFNYEDYSPLAERIIEKANEKGISVSDVIALIKECGGHGGYSY